MVKLTFTETPLPLLKFNEMQFTNHGISEEMQKMLTYILNFELFSVKEEILNAIGLIYYSLLKIKASTVTDLTGTVDICCKN